MATNKRVALGGKRTSIDRWILFGWGAFSLVEGLVNHQILGLHHVRERAGHQTAYDLGFLAFGALLLIVGWLLTRDNSRQTAP